MSGKLFVVSACSGTGKTSLVNAAIENLKNQYPISRVITYTSKKPRINEVNGIDYHFVSIEDFNKKAQEGFFIEWSTAYGTFYGSPKAIIDEVKAGKSFIAILDLDGAKAVKALFEPAVLIWLAPPSFEVLKERLSSRSTENQQEIAFRLELARKELTFENGKNLFSYSLVNDDFKGTLDMFENLLKIELEKKF